MKAIGFKNFRQFQEFPILPIEGVTFLVGENGAGKSTFTKACRLLGENMCKCIKDASPIDYEETKGIFDFLNVCQTLNRAQCKKAPNGDMSFIVKADYFTITYVINNPATSKNLDSRIGDIKSITINDEIDDMSWIYDFTKKKIVLKYSGKLLSHIVSQNIIRQKGIVKISCAKRMNLLKN